MFCLSGNKWAVNCRYRWLRNVLYNVQILKHWKKADKNTTGKIYILLQEVQEYTKIKPTKIIPISCYPKKAKQTNKRQPPNRH